MAEAITLIGACLVGAGALGFLMTLMIHGVLTPTAKSPARPGDLESRRSFAQSMRVEGGLAVVGVVLFVLGVAVQLATA